VRAIDPHRTFLRKPSRRRERAYSPTWQVIGFI
jgi:hypothetical protein